MMICKNQSDTTPPNDQSVERTAAPLFRLRGELVVAGVTNRISMPIGVIPLGGQKLKMTGSTSVKMTNLGIQPPEIKLSGANETLRYRDEIKLSFEWFVGPKAAP